MPVSRAQFNIGQVVQHKHYGFRGVVFDVDFEYSLDEHWYLEACKAMAGLGQPPIEKKQPFYHLLAESNDVTYEAYVSEQNLLIDSSGDPVKHPLINEIFTGKKGSSYFKPSN